MRLLRDTSDQENIPIDDKPSGTKRGKKLNGNSSFVKFVSFSLSSPTVSITFNYLRTCCQNPCLLPSEDVRSNPVQNLSIQPVVAGNGYRCGEEFCEPPIDFESNDVKIFQSSRDGSKDGQHDSQGSDIEFEP